jgi:Flp pilus assembly protein TadG
VSRLRRALGRDEGRVSVYFAIALTALIIIIGLTVDASGKFRMMQRANNIAAEAARAGGQAIDAGQAIPGGPKVVDPALAISAAQAYLTAAGATGVVEIAADRVHLTVTVTLVYHTAMLSYIGITEVTVTGRATAQLLTG